ncbi:MAG: hypothetical protein NC203_00510 [Firmicutes bacterium]|nr:hypothetical protein [[Eubacterium] siraeum]MCM1486821.1 hypothetical protein [Bacillota bacterium]
MDKITLTELFARHCKLLTEDIAAETLKGKCRGAAKLAEVVKNLIELYAKIVDISAEKADELLFNEACGKCSHGVWYAVVEERLPFSETFAHFSRFVNTHLDKEDWDGLNNAFEATVIFAEWKHLSYDEAAIRLMNKAA